MLTRAIERAAEHELIGADSWIRTDSEFLDYLDRKGIGDAQEVKDLVRRLRGGDLYTPIALLASPSIEAYASVSEITSKQKIEAAVLRSANVKGVKILSHFILDKGKTERSISFVDEFGSANTVGQNTRRLLCGVFAASSLSESDRSSIAKAFVDALHEGGVADLEAIVDPMGAIQPLQQQLI
jgi:hypothetical protein